VMVDERAADNDRRDTEDGAEQARPRRCVEGRAIEADVDREVEWQCPVIILHTCLPKHFCDRHRAHSSRSLPLETGLYHTGSTCTPCAGRQQSGRVAGHALMVMLPILRGTAL
jgi:hypothetical protein